MKTEKNIPNAFPLRLILGVVILALASLGTLYARNTTYQQSREVAAQIQQAQEQIEALQSASGSEERIADLESQKSQLAEEKVRLERPYSLGLTALFFALLLCIQGIFSLRRRHPKPKMPLSALAQTGLLAALCYIGFAFLRIDLPVGPEKTAFHFGNVFCVVAALLLGGYYGGLAGAVGMTIADLTTAYVTSAPKTFFLKMAIGLIVGFLAHSVCKIRQVSDPGRRRLYVFLSCAGGMAFNIVADPLAGYFYKLYLLGLPQDLAATLAKLNLLTTSVNAVTAVILAGLIYLALEKPLAKAGLRQTSPEDAL